ncbi:IPT/TIG domain-containing protein [Pedobacter gandavensis]|uniref:IPT/TIG domain-containing protein n=1 Tax=Pedobacter gandavensis TaxID=2679963 RepID=UPI00292F2488|nr:IPT/TIG domain-containing protein [Pedobacter gandavensis]
MKLNLINRFKKGLGKLKVYPLVFGLLLLTITACKKDKVEVVKTPVTVTDYYPNSGNQGTLVTVEGTGFSTNLAEISATFAGVSADVVSATANAVVLRAPLKGSTGELMMKMNGESLKIGQYTFQNLSVQRISPANGGAGAHIRVSGAGFSSIAGPAQVFINNKLSLVVSASDTLLVVEVPDAVGTGVVKVKVDGKEASGQTFKYQAISGIKPLTGGKGTLVRISGEGFEELAEGNYVDFNGKAALVKEATADYLIVVAPDDVKTGPLSVSINQQKITGPIFTVVPPPTMGTVSPLSGPAGSVMTINGENFSTIAEENKVLINGKQLTLSTATATKLTLVIPGNTGNGKVILSVNDQEVTGPEFKDQSLGINKLSPENGLAGSLVTITGTGFNSNAAQNIVSFNGLAGTVISATETSIVVKAPVGLSSGPLKVSNNGAEAIAPMSFNRAGIVTIAGGVGNNSLSLNNGRTSSLAIDAQGNIFVLEVGYHRIKKITPSGTVTLFAGSPSGQSGHKNGKGIEALFSFGTNPGMDIDDQGNLFLSEGVGNIRKVSPQGEVSNFAVGLGSINKISFDKQGVLYVLGSFNGGWRINREGLRTAINLLSFADESRPALNNNVLYKLNYEGYTVDAYDLKTNQNLNAIAGGNWGYADGVGRNAMFLNIKSMTADGLGNLIIADGGANAFRKLNISTKEVITIVRFTQGAAVDGSFADAKVSSIGDTILDAEGNIYFIDINNNSVRKIFLK